MLAARDGEHLAAEGEETQVRMRMLDPNEFGGGRRQGTVARARPCQWEEQAAWTLGRGREERGKE